MARVSKPWTVHVRLLLLLVGFWQSEVACSDDTHHALAAGCSINTDCDSPLVCAFQRCHNACTDSRDCPNGLSCVSSDRPYRVCQLPDERGCTRTSDCPGTEQCAVDGNCRDRCATSADCVSRQICVSASCADVTDLGPDGQLTPKADAALPALCSYNSECPEPYICKDGVCQFECLTSRDCARGESCVRNQCIGPGRDGGASGSGGAGNSTGGTSSGGRSTSPDASVTGELGGLCDYPSDCIAPLRCGPRGTCIYQCSTSFDCAANECCQEHRCITGNACDVDAGIAPVADAGAGPACKGDLECQNGVTCDGFERCVGGHCHPAALAACDDSDPCTTDTCDEKKGTCAHKVSGPVDQDGDGHYAIGAACGASSKLADDCDDNNPNVYPGHPEICDELDNNCNGVADEGVWQLGDATALTKTGAFGIGSATETTPAVVAANGGFTVLATADATTGDVTAFRLAANGKVLGSATLATTTGTDCTTSPGKRVAYPSLASDGSNVLATFFQASSRAGTCCGANAQWTRSSLGVLAAADLSAPKSLSFDVDVDTACLLAAPTTRVGPADVAWIPSLSRYIAAWGDAHSGGGPHAWVAPVTASGTVGGAHTATANEADAALDGNAFPRVFLAASPTHLFVAYAAPGTLRMVLLDPSSLSVVVGPVDLPNSFQTAPLAAAYSGGKFFLMHSTRGSFDISAVDEATLQELRVASISISADSLYSPRLIPTGNGVFLVFSRSATRISYGWVPSTFDSPSPEVFPLTDVDLGKPVSAAGAAALDDKHIALAWVDGNVQTALLTCGQ